MVLWRISPMALTPSKKSNYYKEFVMFLLWNRYYLDFVSVIFVGMNWLPPISCITPIVINILYSVWSHQKQLWCSIGFLSEWAEGRQWLPLAHCLSPLSLHTAITTAVRRCQELAHRRQQPVVQASPLFAVPNQADFMLRRIKAGRAGWPLRIHEEPRESVNV